MATVTLDQRVAVLDQRVVGLDQRLVGLDRRVAGLDERVAVVDQRVAVMEADVANIRTTMATKTDIAGLKIVIAEKETAQIRWLLGIMVTAAVTMGVAVFKTFM